MLTEFTSIANLSATALIGVLLWWLITKGHPDLMQAARDGIAESRRDFLGEIKQERDYRERAMMSGHEAAREIAGAMHENSSEISRLSAAIRDLPGR